MARTKKIDPGYKEQLNLQKYANRRRQEIQDFISKRNPTFITLHEASAAIGSKDPHYENKIFAVLDPQIVASLSYEPIRRVHNIQKLDEDRKIWLIKYWEDKYEIDITPGSEFPEWNHQVGLVFIGCSYYSDYHYTSVYDFPSCLIATFLLVKKEE